MNRLPATRPNAEWLQNPGTVVIPNIAVLNRQLYLTWGTRKGTPMFARVVRRAGDLSGILVNATLTPEGQKALLQVRIERYCTVLYRISPDGTVQRYTLFQSTCIVATQS